MKLIAAHLTEHMATTYLQAATSYCKSVAPELRANAALFVGLVGGHLLRSVSMVFIRSSYPFKYLIE